MTANPLENVPIVSIVRRNHGIEHATVSLLTARRADRRIVARSDTRGFIIFGEIETQELELATKEALRRLQAGDAHMAVHPNCGTNFVTSGMLAGLAAWAVTVLSTQGARKRPAWEALPTAFPPATLSPSVAQP